MVVDTSIRRSSLLSRVVSVVFGGIAFILMLHVVLVLLDANGDNSIVRSVADFASTLAWGFKNFFTNADLKLRTFLNYGLAALVYACVGIVLQRLFRNLG
jgi:hypothetical protein